MLVASPFKKGASFIVTANFRPDDPEYRVLPADLWSQIRIRSDGLVEELVITERSPNVIDFTCDDTTDWPIGNVYMDFVLTVDGKKTPCVTIQIPVNWGVTHE